MRINLVDGGLQYITDGDGQLVKAWVSTFVCETCLEELGRSAVDPELTELAENAAAFRKAADEKFASELVGKHTCPRASK